MSAAAIEGPSSRDHNAEMPDDPNAGGPEGSQPQQPPDPMEQAKKEWEKVLQLAPTMSGG